MVEGVFKRTHLPRTICQAIALNLEETLLLCYKNKLVNLKIPFASLLFCICWSNNISCHIKQISIHYHSPEMPHRCISTYFCLLRFKIYVYIRLFLLHRCKEWSWNYQNWRYEAVCPVPALWRLCSKSEFCCPTMFLLQLINIFIIDETADYSLD